MLPSYLIILLLCKALGDRSDDKFQLHWLLTHICSAARLQLPVPIGPGVTLQLKSSCWHIQAPWTLSSKGNRCPTFTEWIFKEFQWWKSTFLPRSNYSTSALSQPNTALVLTVESSPTQCYICAYSYGNWGSDSMLGPPSILLGFSMSTRDASVHVTQWICVINCTCLPLLWLKKNGSEI